MSIPSQRITGSRRDFLRRGAGLGAAGLALSAVGPAGLPLAAATGSARKLLVIFQRGGNDGINTVIPRGDRDYNQVNRPALFVPENLAIDLGNGFAQFHPRMQPVMEIFDRQDLTGRPGPGNLAILHRVGYANQWRSHRESQRVWEEGGWGSGLMPRGMFRRFLAGRAGQGAVRCPEAALGTMENFRRAAVEAGEDSSEGGGAYPQTPFGERLHQAALWLKRTSSQIAQVDQQGWDTHAGQGWVNGPHGDLLAELAQGIRALHRQFQREWNDLLIVTMTEFGRSSRENGSRGTDHGEAGVMLVAGGAVRGGVYNCDASAWKAGDLFSLRGRHLARRTDFRAVFGEIFTRHFGDSPERLSQIMPGYTEAAEQCPDDFARLGFLG